MPTLVVGYLPGFVTRVAHSGDPENGDARADASLSARMCRAGRTTDSSSESFGDALNLRQGEIRMHG